MRFTRDNFYEALSKYNFEEELIKSSLLMQLENYEAIHFFIYEELDKDGQLESIDLVFCNNKYYYNINLIVDLNEVVFDYDFCLGINIKVLEEKMNE